MNSPFDWIAYCSEVFARGSILYCVVRIFNIPPRNLLTKDTDDYVTGSGKPGSGVGVAISCATCAIREKQRSRTGDLDKRPENHAPNSFFSFHRPPPLPILFALEKAEHASAKKIETCINVCYGLDIRNSRITVRSNRNDTLPPMFLSSWRSSIEFVTKRIDVHNIRGKKDRTIDRRVD